MLEIDVSEKPISYFSYLRKVILLAALYMLSGKLGLLLAVPPGYATVIWPASGIAIGMLILQGWRLWPGILIGSFILNCYIADAVSIEHGIIIGKVLAAAGIAVGSTLQALTGRFLISRFIGLPLKLYDLKQMLALFFLSGPLACLIAATIGVGTLYSLGVVPSDKIIDNWLTWWMGDTFGVLVFLPLMLVAPGGQNQLTWRGNKVESLSILAMFTLLVPLGLTFYSWKIASENSYRSSLEQFTALASENEKALLNRIDAYNYALLGAAGFVQGSNFISREGWRQYVDTLDVSRNFPGINGVGLINPVSRAGIPDFLKSIRSDNAATFEIHPNTKDGPYYIATYIEPASSNGPAIGLNIAFENNRREAAEASRDTGLATITHHINLVQYTEKTPGFLLLHPVYQANSSLNTVEERRQAFRGWVFAPFVAKNFLKDLTNSQGKNLHLEVYDGGSLSNDNLIFNDQKSDAAVEKSGAKFTVQKKITVMQREWTLVWKSTDFYELEHQNNSKIFIVVGGLLFTGLFGLFLMIASVRNSETIELITEEKKFVLPAIIFIATSIGAFFLYAALKQHEINFVASMVKEETSKIEQLISAQTNDKILALKRMAQRWDVANRIPENQWRADAQNHIGQLSGLTAVEWVDSSYYVRRVEPVEGNEKAVGLNVLYNQEREDALKGAAERNAITLTPPLDLVQGYKAFIAYAPMQVHGKFDGFMVGIFNIEKFFDPIISGQISENYAVSLNYGGKEFFKNMNFGEMLDTDLTQFRTIEIYDKKIDLKITPTEKFIESQRTFLPIIVLIGGMVIAVLLSLSVRYVLISRLKSSYLSKSRQKMKESEERYDLVVRGMSVGLWDWNLVTGELYWSSKLNQIFGITEGNFLTNIEYFSECLHPDDRDVALKMLNDHLEHRGPYNTEYRFRRPDGSYIWVQAAGQAEWDKDGRPVRMAGSVVDISQRVAASRALQESDNLKSAVLSGARHMVIVTDLNGVIKIFNDASEKEFGYSAEEIVDKKTPEIFHEPKEVIERAKVLTQELGMHIEPGFETFVKKVDLYGVDENEWNFVRKDGSHFPVSLTITLLKDENGHTTGYLGVIENITERKKAEQALKVSEETFRSAMENASIGMALVSTEGKWLTVNNALCNLLGYAEEDFLKTDFQTITHPDDLEKDLGFVRAMLAGELETYQMEKRYFRKDGNIIWILLSVSLAHDHNGQPKYFISQMQDITERKEMDRMKGEFISVVSHELRTPLTSIRGSLGLIQGVMSKDIPEKANHLIGLAYKNTERLILLINDILDIDKIASGQMQFDMKDEILSSLVSHGIETNIGFGDKYKVRFETEYIRPDIIIHVDASRWQQVFSNLLSNAAKFSPENGAIKISAAVKDNVVRLSVSDSGPGIPEEFRSRIFGKFSQADSTVTRTKGGSGLGLNISKQLIEAMHGKIGFDTEVGKGTTFWIDLPYLTAGHGDRVEGKIEYGRENATNRNSIKVLHVEDDDDFTKVIEASLDEHMEVVSVSSVAEAKKHLQNDTFSLVILDIGLPDESGLSLVDYIHETVAKPAPIVILSADEPPAGFKGKVASVIVKSRMSETKIIDTIIALIKQNASKGYSDE